LTPGCQRSLGTHLVDHAPFGHWNTQTFIAALRHDRLDAPWVIDGAMNRELFDIGIETQLLPNAEVDVLIDALELAHDLFA